MKKVVIFAICGVVIGVIVTVVSIFTEVNAILTTAKELMNNHGYGMEE